jgi:SPP1 gp7 family putative phage head morphogenesis protein
LSPAARERIRQIGNEQLRELGLSISFNMLNPEVVRFLEELGGKRITDINETTREQIRNAIIAGTQAGDGARQLRDRVSEVFAGVSQGRAMTIARTESLMAQSFASHSAWTQSGLIAEKQFLAVIDGATRDTHLGANGQVVAVDAPFVLPDGDQGQYPGDFADAGNNINCRCAGIAVVGEPKAMSELAAHWKAAEAKRQEFENQILVATRRAFRAQESDVLTAVFSVFGP